MRLRPMIQRSMVGWRAKVADFFALRAPAETVAGHVAGEWREEGFTEGKEEGFVDGEQSGIAKGMIQLMPLLVQIRFGLETQPELTDRLSDCDVSQLQALQQAVTTAESLDAWLAMI